MTGQSRAETKGRANAAATVDWFIMVGITGGWRADEKSERIPRRRAGGLDVYFNFELASAPSQSRVPGHRYLADNCGADEGGLRAAVASEGLRSATGADPLGRPLRSTYQLHWLCRVLPGAEPGLVVG